VVFASYKPYENKLKIVGKQFTYILPTLKKQKKHRR